MNDRHTQQAELFFSRARTESILTSNMENGRKVTGLDSPSQQRYQTDMAHGLENCALAIRDVYDKLIEIEKKVDALTSVTAAGQRIRA